MKRLDFLKELSAIMKQKTTKPKPVTPPDFDAVAYAIDKAFREQRMKGRVSR